MSSLVIRFLEFWQHFGWRGVYSFVFPVYWTQDYDMANEGYDLLAVFRPKQRAYYFWGTRRDHNKVWAYHP